MDKDSCDERKDTIIVLEGGIPNARHNYNSLSMLEPNAGAWSNLLPSCPYSSTMASGALIKGTIYMATYEYRSKAGVYMKLEQGSRFVTAPPSAHNASPLPTPASDPPLSRHPFCIPADVRPAVLCR